MGCGHIGSVVRSVGGVRGVMGREGSVQVRELINIPKYI